MENMLLGMSWCVAWQLLCCFKKEEKMILSPSSKQKSNFHMIELEPDHLDWFKFWNFTASLGNGLHMFISWQKEAFPFIGPKQLWLLLRDSPPVKRGSKTGYKLYRLARSTWVLPVLLPTLPEVGGLELLSHTEPLRSQAVGSLQLQN